MKSHEISPRDPGTRPHVDSTLRSFPESFKGTLLPFEVFPKTEGYPKK